MAVFQTVAAYKFQDLETEPFGNHSRYWIGPEPTRRIRQQGHRCDQSRGAAVQSVSRATRTKLGFWVTRPRSRLGGHVPERRDFRRRAVPPSPRSPFGTNHAGLLEGRALQKLSSARVGCCSVLVCVLDCRGQKVREAVFLGDQKNTLRPGAAMARFLHRSFGCQLNSLE
jgi:hypothetical protein